MSFRGSSKLRIVRPAILSIVGAYSPFYIASFWLPLSSTLLGSGIIVFLGGMIIGGWFCVVSILLLLDTVRHRIWGSLAAVTYSLAFPLLFFYSWFTILASSQFGVLTQATAWLSIITPLVGLIGGVWGYLWKPHTAAIMPETLAVKPPRSGFPRDKPFIPALLSVAATAPLLFLLSTFVAALFAPPQPLQEGSVGPDFGFIFVPALVGGAALLVLLPTIFTVFLLFDPLRHKRWGMVLTIWWGLASAYVFVALVNALVNIVNVTSSGTLSPSLYTFLFFTPFLGLAGGVWGIYWHTGVNPRAWTQHTIARTLRGLSVRVTAGGLASFLCLIFSNSVVAIFAILSFFLIIGNIALGRRGVRSRARGIALMGLVVAIVFFLLIFETLEYLNAPWEIGPRTAGLAAIVATMVAGSGLVWSIRGPLIPRWKRLSTTLAFVALVTVLVGSVFAYAVVAIQARQNLPKPNVTLTNIGVTYMENCGPSGSLTTTFNMTATLVNTGGFGVATLGYVVNGQQVASQGYYVHPNTQVTYSYIVTVHACYGAQPPTCTVVLLSEHPA